MLKKHRFSLIELLVVLGIIGALVSLVLPGFSDTSDHAREKAVQSEMREIQAAFRRFAEDVRLKSNTDNMEDVINYGVWPLTDESHPTGSGIEYIDYDAETGTGRRGPYLRRESTIAIAASPSNNGQPEAEGGTVTIPVIKDPYGGYYRIMCPEIAVGDTDADILKKRRKMVLICTGSNTRLDTAPTDLENNEIKAQNDDTVIRLMPLATY